MLLKTFVKRKKGGDFVNNQMLWTEEYFESPRIMKRSREDNFVFVFYVDNEGIEPEYREIEVHEKTQGYELYNNAGVLIEKFVTGVDDEDDHLSLDEKELIIHRTRKLIYDSNLPAQFDLYWEPMEVELRDKLGLNVNIDMLHRAQEKISNSQIGLKNILERAQQFHKKHKSDESQELLDDLNLILGQ